MGRVEQLGLPTDGGRRSRILSEAGASKLRGSVPQPKRKVNLCSGALCTEIATPISILRGRVKRSDRCSGCRVAGIGLDAPLEAKWTNTHRIFEAELA